MIKYKILFVFILALMASGCISAKKHGDRHVHDSIYKLEQLNRQLGLKLKSLQQELAAQQVKIDQFKSLQSKLHAKQTKIEQLKFESQQATQQVVRTRAKLRSHHSKDSIVVHLSEVKTELNSLAEKPLNKSQQQTVQEARLLIEKSVEALNSEDLETAFSLSNKAQKLLIPLLALQTKKQARLDVDFATPLMMTIKKECNVRKGPGMKNKSLFTMDAGSKVTAFAFVRNWINIETESRKNGWIYYRLLMLDQSKKAYQ
jgi:hypothetical protein